ncbi:MAG: iron-sulfur cluster assembly accessory protein [Deltaproteobacteria bacterium]|nr:iron-sulfur cluster assembly accessory protein [Deltaproteobacteria bacterium]
MITVTPRAAARAVKLAENKGVPKVMRVGVKGGGCSGFSYYLEFDDVPRDGDQSLEVDGLKVVVDPKSLLYLDGTEVDFVPSLLKGGFTFNNPKAKHSCSCGESFSA